MSAGGRKSRILMSMNVASELRDRLDTFDEYLRTLGNAKSKALFFFIYQIFDHLGEHNPNNQQATEDGRLRSILISRDDRKYYLDLKENERGRFLRVCQLNVYCLKTFFFNRI